MFRQKLVKRDMCDNQSKNKLIMTATRYLPSTTTIQQSDFSGVFFIDHIIILCVSVYPFDSRLRTTLSRICRDR